MQTATIKLKETPIRKFKRGAPATIQDRIDYVRCVFGFPVPAFAKRIGNSVSTIEKILQEGKEPTLTVLNSLILTLPVNKTWIRTGQGSPFTVPDVSSYNHNQSDARVVDDGTNDVADRLKIFRENTGKNQAIFAASIDLSRDQYQFVESKRTILGLKSLAKLVGVYNVSADWLLTGEGEMYRRKR